MKKLKKKHAWGMGVRKKKRGCARNVKFRSTMVIAKFLFLSSIKA